MLNFGIITITVAWDAVAEEKKKVSSAHNCQLLPHIFMFTGFETFSRNWKQPFRPPPLFPQQKSQCFTKDGPP